MFEFLKRLFGRGQGGGGDSMAPQDRAAAQALGQAGYQVPREEVKASKPRRPRNEYDRDPPPDQKPQPKPLGAAAALPGAELAGKSGIETP